MKLSPAVLHEIEAHATETFPDECCGVLIGEPDGSVTVRRIRNVQNEMHAADPERYPRTAAIAYTGDAGELKAALDEAERPGRRLVAFYHSHPDHDAYFSDEDVRQATPFGEPSYPDALQIVISLYARELRAVKAFGWSEQAASYVEVALERE